jgi:hypothetical protein
MGDLPVPISAEMVLRLLLTQIELLEFKESVEFAEVPTTESS